MTRKEIKAAVVVGELSEEILELEKNYTVVIEEIKKAASSEEEVYYSAVLSEKLGYGDSSESGVVITIDEEPIITVDNGEVYPPEYTPFEFITLLSY